MGRYLIASVDSQVGANRRDNVCNTLADRKCRDDRQRNGSAALGRGSHIARQKRKTISAKRPPAVFKTQLANNERAKFIYLHIYRGNYANSF